MATAITVVLAIVLVCVFVGLAMISFLSDRAGTHDFRSGCANVFAAFLVGVLCGGAAFLVVAYHLVKW